VKFEREKKVYFFFQLNSLFQKGREKRKTDDDECLASVDQMRLVKSNSKERRPKAKDRKGRKMEEEEDRRN
jgi:hypothetical protein